MSGGSWNYLYNKDIDDLIRNTDLLQNMANRLAGLGYATDCAKETQELLLIIRQFMNHAEAIKDRLATIWKSIEWWDSCDSGEDEFIEELRKYRNTDA